MKKIIMFTILLAGGVFASCQREFGEDVWPRSVNLQVSVEEIGPNLPAATRAAFAADDDEKNVAGLYLLFFQYSASGSGEFVKAYRVGDVPRSSAAEQRLDNPFALAIGTGEGAGLSQSESYSIIAIANLDAYVDWNLTSSAALKASLTASNLNTEKEVAAAVLNLPATISKSALPMIGRTTKMADQDLVEVKLSRAVARIDLENLMDTRYRVESVSITGVAERSRLLPGEQIEGVLHSAFYKTVAPAASGDVEGEFYAFENFEGDPLHAGKAKATALIVELSPIAGNTNALFSGNRFYRVTIAPEESAQSIQRNNYYKVSLRDVLAEGAASAANAEEGELDATINNWDIGDEGMVITDGKSTMAVPSKYVRFGPEAGSRSYSIFATGPGTLSITKTDLPNGFTATMDGNILTVTAPALLGNEKEGTLELGYGGLRGTVTVIQMPEDNLWLTLNRTSLPIFYQTAGNGIDAGSNPIGGDKIQISASGHWKAQIYNSGSSDNPGFSFNGAKNPNNTWKTEWDSQVDGISALDFVTTGANPEAAIRYSFAVFSLYSDNAEENERLSKYRQTLILSQNEKGEIRIEGYLPVMAFDMAGVPMSISNPPSGNYYEMTVNGNYGTDWNYEVTGADAADFDVQVIENTLYVKAKGTEGNGLNLDVQQDATLMITKPAVDPVSVSLTQQQFVFTAAVKTGTGYRERVPVDGTHTNVLHKIYNPGGQTASRYAPEDFTNYVAVTVNDDFPASLEWEARIVEYSHSVESNPAYVGPEHKGYLISGSGTGTTKVAALTGAGNNRTTELHVGFDKVYYPIVHFEDDPNTPWVKIRFNIKGKPALTTECIVYQEPLVAKTPVGNIMAYGGANYASIATGGYYTRNYADALVDGAYFGPSGVVRAPATASKATHTTGMTVTPEGVASVPGVGYIHAGGTNIPGTYYTATANGETMYGTRAIERWRNNYEGFVLYAFSDSRGGYLTEPLSTLNIIGWKTEGSEAGGYTYNTETNSVDKRVMKYLLRGPFGETSTNNFVFANATAGDPTPLTASEVATATPNAVVAVRHVGSGNPMTVIDPANRVAFVSETETFMGNSATAAGPQTADVQLFMQNFGAIMMNGLMYGSHFYDTLREDFYPEGPSVAATRPLWVIRKNGSDYQIVNLNQ